MKRINYRTVKNNRIRLGGKILTCPDLKGELEGHRFLFIPYADLSPTSGFSHDGLTFLWGTERYSKALNQSSKGVLTMLYEQDKAILAPHGVFRWQFWQEAAW